MTSRINNYHAFIYYALFIDLLCIFGIINIICLQPFYTKVIWFLDCLFNSKTQNLLRMFRYSDL